jgi:ACS family sodium-dependent inorganic phosphate cotransporter
MKAEAKRKEQERATRVALADAAAVDGKRVSPMESVDELPISTTFSKLEKSLPPDSAVPWAEFFK